MFRTLAQLLLPVFIILCSLSFKNLKTNAFTFNTNHQKIAKLLLKTNGGRGAYKTLFPSKASNEEENVATIDYVDEDAPADVGGAKFFGGNAEKEELYDPVAEAQADTKFEESSTTYTYERFNNELFENDTISTIAKKLQLSFNSICHDDNEEEEITSYNPTNFVWNSPLKSKSNKTPLDEIKSAKDFYRRIHVSILSGKEISTQDNGMDIELRWEISVVWPAAYEPCVVLTGTSKLHLSQSSSNADNNEYTITSQTDIPDSKEYLTTIASQLTPRFWDLYHIAMTPSAQLLPRTILSNSNIFQPYKVYEVQPTFVLAPTLKDTNNRDDRLGQSVPNHAFSTIIKTMGPKKQRYVPTSPIEIQIDQSILNFSIYVPTEISSYPVQLCAKDENNKDTASCQYTFKPKRIVATLPYEGNSQDEQVSNLRKKLYQSILQNSSEYKPKLSDDGKPIFFFWMNNCKACFVRDGLGMAVYDYRPSFAKCNEIGIELEKK